MHSVRNKVIKERIKERKKTQRI